MIKTCTSCNTPKELELFAKAPGRKYGRHSHCKACVNERCKKYYHLNPEKKKEQIKKANKSRGAARLNQVYEYLSNHPCAECGESNIVMLQFDHLRDKDFNIVHAARLGYSWDTILKEIEKCEVVCANHHAVRTFERCNSKRVNFQNNLEKI